MSESTGAPEGGKFRYRADMAPPQPAPVASKGFKCPNCGGPVNLELPGKSVTIRCPKCSSILEPEHEVLKLRDKYNEQFPHRQWIPMGTEGTLNGIKFKCVGMVVRGDDDGGEWSEYLLFNPYHGYRYLVESSGHWTLIEQAPGLGFDKSGRPGWYGPTGTIKVAGKKLKYFTHYRATVKNIIGEFPWQATIGETNEVTEYINPPYQASCENVTQYFDKKGRQVDIASLIAAEAKSSSAGSDDEDDEEEDDDEGVDIDAIIAKHGLTKRITESNWSIGEYKYPEEIQAAFKLEEMPAKLGFGMCEPNPMRARYLVSLAITGLLFLATCGTCSVASGRAEEKVVFDKAITLNTAEFELKKEGTTDYLEFNFEPGTIELTKESNVEFDFRGNLNQEWISLNVFMINEQTGRGFIYDGELSYYYGGSGEDKWSEGGNSTDFTTEKMPPGQYYLFVAGATNIGVNEFKRNLQIYGERVEAPPAVPATGPLGKTQPGKPGAKAITPAKPAAAPASPWKKSKPRCAKPKAIRP
ncbi:MAG TPA: DUF4178 domain-containing protein, partial [Turneriella sp.]|nr:DUF4178 domain-containing protein [Turneriella sp.]